MGRFVASGLWQSHMFLHFSSPSPKLLRPQTLTLGGISLGILHFAGPSEYLSEWVHPVWDCSSHFSSLFSQSPRSPVICGFTQAEKKLPHTYTNTLTHPHICTHITIIQVSLFTHWEQCSQGLYIFIGYLLNQFKYLQLCFTSWVKRKTGLSPYYFFLVFGFFTKESTHCC